MKRAIAWLLLLLLLIPLAVAEETPDMEEEIPYSKEEMAEAVERLPLLLRAFAGVDFAAEQKAWKKLSADELLLKQEEMREYRASTRPLLCEILFPEDEEALLPEELSEEELRLREEMREEALENAFASLSATAPGQELLALLAEREITGREGLVELGRAWVGAWLCTIDAEKLTEQNADYRFWIYCPDTPIDYPVCHYVDNVRYMRYMFNGERNACGTIFVDYRNLDGFEDPNTLIYGHHMRNRSMFGSLPQYELPGYFEAHPYFLLVTAERLVLCEAFAGYTTGANDHCYDIAISDEADFAAFVEEAVAKSDFDSGIVPEIGSTLVTLSTCTYKFRNARYIAICKLHGAR